MLLHAALFGVEATPAGLASCVNTSLHTRMCKVNTHRHQAKSAGMTDHLHQTTRKVSLELPHLNTHPDGAPNLS